VLAREIADDLQTALDQFTAIAGELGEWSTIGEDVWAGTDEVIVTNVASASNMKSAS